MVQKVTNTKIGLQDPSVQRTVTRTIAQQAIIANGSPKLENLNRAIPTAVIPSTTAKASPSAVSLTTSANNVPSDTVTIYPSSGNVYLTAVDQNFRNTIVNQFGVSAIIAGNNISITSSNGDGTGNVTISAASGGPGGAYLANGNSWANIPVYSGNVLISANNKIWTFNTTGNLDLPGNVEIGTEIGLVSINIEGNPNVTTFSNAGITVSGNANITGNVNVGTNLSVSGTSLFGANASMDSFNINDLADPIAPQDAATKYYVDTFVTGLSIRLSANAATTSNLATITGGTVTYNNGTLGVGANLTIAGGTLTTIDTVSLTAGMRVLIKNETANAAWNGVYTYDSSTVLTRTTDFDTSAEMSGGAFLFVTTGDVNSDTAWVQTTDMPVMGTDPIVFSQFSGAGSFSADQGVNLTGSIFSANTDGITTTITSGNIVVKASAQLTTPNIGDATGNSLTLAGNLTTSGISTLGPIGNLKLSGGTNGQVLSTDGAGNLSFISISSSGVSNGTSNITIPLVNSNINFAVNGNANVLVVDEANVTASGSVAALEFISGNASSNSQAMFASFANSTATITPTILDTFSASGNNKSASYQLQAISAGNVYYTMLNLATDGTNVFVSLFGEVTTSLALATYDATIVSGNVELTFTPASAVLTTVKGLRTRVYSAP